MLSVLAALALTPATPAVPADHCQSLAGRLDPAIFSKVETATVDAKAAMPAYCRVKGSIKPSIGFEMRLPLSGWNGNFYQSGCGGYCGQLTTETPGYANGIVESVKRGYAAIHTDSGHPAASQGDSAWALGNPAAVALYAHGWIPLSHTAGIAVARTFYGRDPRYRYLVGCSNGGRIGLMAAQRYPDLFNGIIVGCPAVDLTNSGGAFGAWKLTTNRDAGAPILNKEFVRKLPFLIEAINAQCDRLDGSTDGLIARPSACKIDYAKIRSCPAGTSAATSPDNCLTADEKRVVQLWHQGPRDSNGRKLFGGMPLGGEDYWKVWYLRPASEAVGTQLADGFTRHIVSDPKQPGFSASTFNFDTDPARLSRDFGFLNANNPDLSAFRKAGGKLIMWHGMADPLVVPSQSVEYYNRVLKQMGGTAKVQQFFRFFLAPGLGHCWEIPSRNAPEAFDPLTAIEDWVERGAAPDRIVASPSERQGDNLSITEVHYRPYPLQPVVGKKM
jgi:pimeloyl-ACP methyl ester carboxylesterase